MFINIGKLLLKIIIYTVLLIPYWLSWLTPRNKNILVFGSWFGFRYSDNSRYVYDYVNENEKSIRAVWLSRKKEIVKEIRSKGNEAYLVNSLKGYWLSCRAGAVFVTSGSNDINKFGISRAKKIQLWHGTNLKKIGFDDKITSNPDRSFLYRLLKSIWYIIFPFMNTKWDMLISPSPAVNENLASAFCMDLSQVKLTGYPRGDIILKPKPEILPEIERFKNKWNASNIISYLPTFRDSSKTGFNLFNGLSIDDLNNTLKRHDAVLFIKMHYVQSRLKSNFFTDIEKSRICWCTEEILPDINKLLPFVDVLITDYSSVFFDFLLLNRPIIFTPFDKKQYLTKDRELYEDYDSVTPGPKCYNWTEVIDTLDEILNGIDNFAEQRKKISKKYNTFTDTNNSKRVVEKVKEIIAF
jgi:CDP-glycerol glycerophosphotransferase (TagB/SpsB family)